MISTLSLDGSTDKRVLHMSVITKGNPIRLRNRPMFVCLLIGVSFLQPSAGWCDDRPVQQDPAIAAGFDNCDSRAQQESARVSTLTPIAPTSVLNPVLLLNDLNRRKQEEANQPQLLNQIELERRQCRQNVVAEAARRAQETIDQRSDDARGYKTISFDTFALDAKSLAAAEARISMSGAYVPDGNFEWLFPGQGEAMQASLYPAQGQNIAKIPLLTEDASRDFRRFLLKCKSVPGSDRMGCLTVVTGHASMCEITGPFGARRKLPCLIVENGRQVR
jgi:hypothetical protein